MLIGVLVSCLLLLLIGVFAMDIPQSWSLDCIVPVYKKDEKNDLDTYRGITQAWVPNQPHTDFRNRFYTTDASFVYESVINGTLNTRNGYTAAL